MRGGGVEDSFKLLEDKVQKAAVRLRELSAERETLRAEVAAAVTRADRAEAEAQSARARAEQAERELGAARESVRADDGEASRAEAAEQEAAQLRRRQDELRKRMAKLVELLESLE